MIISVANQKGGAAKTTTAVNLAAGHVLEGYKALLLDMDPQTTTIPKNISLEEAHSYRTHIFDYSPTSADARAYRALGKEVLER